MEHALDPPPPWPAPSTAPALNPSFDAMIRLRPGLHVHVLADVVVVSGRVRYTLEDFDCVGQVLDVENGKFTIQTVTPIHHRHIIIEVLLPAIKNLEIV